MNEFDGKNILVVGASSGIGETTARLLYDKGAKVILLARREKELAEICEEFEDGRGVYYTADISDIQEIEKLIDRIVAERGKMDAMVYAAGVTDDVPLKFLSYERLKQSFDTNYFGFVELVRQLSKKKNYNPGMRIVALSSIASIHGEKAHTAYAATKAAIDATVRCLAKELYGKGIALNTVQPSMINTRMYEEYLESSEDREKAEQEILKRQYAGIGRTEDVANAIAFLLSDGSGFITGISLPVDGGYSTS